MKWVTPRDRHGHGGWCYPPWVLEVNTRLIHLIYTGNLKTVCIGIYNNKARGIVLITHNAPKTLYVALGLKSLSLP